MTIISRILVASIALEHFYILYLEMFLWTQPAGMKTLWHDQRICRSVEDISGKSGLVQRLPSQQACCGALCILTLPLGIRSRILLPVVRVTVAGVYGGMTVNVDPYDRRASARRADCGVALLTSVVTYHLASTRSTYSTARPRY